MGERVKIIDRLRRRAVPDCECECAICAEEAQDLALRDSWLASQREHLDSSAAELTRLMREIRHGVIDLMLEAAPPEKRDKIAEIVAALHDLYPEIDDKT